jgi:hypothetical protein
MKKSLRHFDRERLIWDSNIKPEQKLILLAYNTFWGGGDSAWPPSYVISEMTGLHLEYVDSAEVQGFLQAWRKGLPLTPEELGGAS